VLDVNARTRERLRRCWPLLLALLVVAVILVRTAGSIAAGEWRDALDERLADAGAGTNAAMVDVERDHLAALRAFSFTTGFPEALESLDIATVEQLLGPVDANLGVAMVDVLDADGRVVFALRGDGQVPPIYRDRNDVGIVQRALQGEPDQYGDRFSTMLVTDEGALVASTGSVKVGDQVVGALLVMTPLSDVLTASTNLNGSMVTVYTGDGGVPLATTAPVKPRTLPGSLDELLPAEDLPATSSYDVPDGTAREQLGALVIRHEDVAWLGVAEEDRSGSVGRIVSLVTALAILLCCGIVVALTLAWRAIGMPDGDDVDVDEPPRTPSALPVPDADPLEVRSPVSRSRW
jgi:hypothetical protein